MTAKSSEAVTTLALEQLENRAQKVGLTVEDRFEKGKLLRLWGEVSNLVFSGTVAEVSAFLNGAIWVRDQLAETLNRSHES